MLHLRRLSMTTNTARILMAGRPQILNGLPCLTPALRVIVRVVSYQPHSAQSQTTWPRWQNWPSRASCVSSEAMEAAKTQVPSTNSAINVSIQSAVLPFLEISAGGRSKNVAMKRKEGKVSADDGKGVIVTGETRERRVHQGEALSAPTTVLRLDMRTTGVTTEVTTHPGVAVDEIHIQAVEERSQCSLLRKSSIVVHLHHEEAVVGHETSHCTTGSRGVPGEDQDARLPRSTRVRLYDLGLQ